MERMRTPPRARKQQNALHERGREPVTSLFRDSSRRLSHAWVGGLLAFKEAVTQSNKESTKKSLERRYFGKRIQTDYESI